MELATRHCVSYLYLLFWQPVTKVWANTLELANEAVYLHLTILKPSIIELLADTYKRR